MLNTQVNYWTLVENKRHNLAQEEIAMKQAEASLSQAKSAERQASTAERSADIKLFEAYTGQQNADTNRMNAETNKSQAQWNYEIAQGNLAVAERNASTNAVQAQNAARQAKVAERNVAITEKQSPSVIAKNKADAKLTSAKAATESIKTDQAALDLGYSGLEHQYGLEKIKVENAAKTVSTATSSIKDLSSAITSFFKFIPIGGN